MPKGNETEVRALGTIPIGAETIASSDVYQELRGLRIPEPFAAILGKFDIQVAMALESIQRTLASVIDRKAGQSLLEAYEAKLDAEKEVEDDATEVGLVALAVQPPRAPLPLQLLPQRAAAATYPGESINELRYPVHPDQLGNGQITLAPFQGVALVVVNGTTYAAAGDANSSIGLVRVITNGYATISLAGDRRIGGFSGLTPGLVYYIQTPGTASLVAEVNLVTGRIASGRGRSRP
jgi:hypothetical protein